MIIARIRGRGYTDNYFWLLTRKVFIVRFYFEIFSVSYDNTIYFSFFCDTV